MVVIKPFKGLLYNKDKINIQEVVTEPYDKISPELQDIYYKRSEYNAVRFVLGKIEEADTDKNNRYTRAAELLNEYKRKGILVESEKPQFYAYYQEYKVDGTKKVRKGLVALVKLEDFASKNIRPHEKTLSKPKEDRLKLLRATKTHFEHIFMLYSDPENKVNAVLAEVTSAQKPMFEVKDEYGSKHKLWVVEDADLNECLVDLMKDKYLLIADGHHRYETACNYSKENNAWGSAADPNNYQMMTLINMEDSSLTVLPTHRLVHGLKGFSKEDFFLKVDKYFKIFSYSTYEEMEVELIKPKKDKPRFGMYENKRFHLLEMKDLSVMDTDIETDHSSDWKRLDVSILHTLILEKILGITLEKQAAQENITYKRSSHDAIVAVDSGKEQLCFFLNPTDVHDVAKLAENGETMPQKSTDFFPKLLTGLLFQQIAN